MRGFHAVEMHVDQQPAARAKAADLLLQQRAVGAKIDVFPLQDEALDQAPRFPGRSAARRRRRSRSAPRTRRPRPGIARSTAGGASCRRIRGSVRSRRTTGCRRAAVRASRPAETSSRPPASCEAGRRSSSGSARREIAWERGQGSEIRVRACGCRIVPQFGRVLSDTLMADLSLTLTAKLTVRCRSPSSSFGSTFTAHCESASSGK